jgi:WD40 repeat protein
MTRPERPDASGQPRGRGHADLVADLTRALSLRDGLAQILKVDLTALPPAGIGPAEPDTPVHEQMVATLAAALPSAALERLLATHSDSAALISDLTTRLDTDRGLAAIRVAVNQPDTVGHHAATLTGQVAPAPAEESLLDGVAKIYQAPAVHRLLLRTSGIHRHLHDARRDLEAIRTILATSANGTSATADDPAPVAAVLAEQQPRLTQAITLLAGAIARRPELETTPRTPTNPLRTLMPGHTGWVLSVAIASDGTWLATGGGDGTVQIWDPATGRQHTVLPGHSGSVRSVAIAPDGTWLATASSDVDTTTVVRVRDLASGRQRTLMTGRAGSVRSVAIAPDGTWLATAGGDDRTTVQIWDPETGRQRSKLTGHTGVVGSLSIAPDGTWMATGGDDGTVRIWDPAISQQYSELAGLLSVGIAPDSTRPGHAGDWAALSQNRELEPGELSVSPEVLRSAASKAVPLIRACADDLAKLRKQLTRHAYHRLQQSAWRRYSRLIGDLAPTLERVHTVLSDFRGADLRTVPPSASEDLDGVRWSDAIPGIPATQWPESLRGLVHDHSDPVDGQPGVFEIHFGVPIPLTT